MTNNNKSDKMTNNNKYDDKFSRFDILRKMTTTMLASFFAEIITQPICVVKTNYQTTNMTTKQTVKYVYDNFGLKGFYMASIPAVVSQIASTTFKFTIYENLRMYRETKSADIYNNSINGMIGGIVGCTIVHPIDVWKNFNQRGKSIIEHFNSSIKSNKLIRNFYAGYPGSLGKNILLYSMLFPLHDYLKHKFNNNMISAPLTTIIVSVVLQPLDYYKTVVIAKQNPTHFYRGFHLTISRAIPHFFITMQLIDLFREF